MIIFIIETSFCKFDKRNNKRIEEKLNFNSILFLAQTTAFGFCSLFNENSCQCVVFTDFCPVDLLQRALFKMKLFLIILVVCAILVIAEERTFDSFWEAEYPNIYAGNYCICFFS